MNPKDLSLNDIAVGDSASFEHVCSDEDVRLFSRLTGDENPLHLDDTYARTTQFKRRLVHGMLVGSLCSALVGMHLPGKQCLYLSQTLVFKKPVFIGDTVMVVGTVTSKSISSGVLEISIQITMDEEEVVNGIAKVRMLA